MSALSTHVDVEEIQTTKSEKLLYAELNLALKGLGNPVTGSIARASNNRSSIPSKRPQRMVTPGPVASSRTRCWVSGLPRGVIASSGAAGWRSTA